MQVSPEPGLIAFAECYHLDWPMAPQAGIPYAAQREPASTATMREYKIAAIPGDGIGVEVIAAGLEVLDVLAGLDGTFRLHVEQFPWSSDYYLEHGYYIPADGLER